MTHWLHSTCLLSSNNRQPGPGDVVVETGLELVWVAGLLTELGEIKQGASTFSEPALMNTAFINDHATKTSGTTAKKFTRRFWEVWSHQSVALSIVSLIRANEPTCILICGS